jgi:peptidoglycan hydrolase-like protein with peptidoglycan-binding domain
MAGDWNSAMHPRAAKGQAGGGEFAAGSSSSSSVKSKKPAGKPAGRTVPKGSLGYDGKRGTGYGKKGGDARVKRLQASLNKLGIKDANGKPLALDGDLGPKTTAAIKAWQRKTGQKPTGFVDAATLRKLGGGRAHATRGHGTHHVRARAASRGAAASTHP